MIAHQSKRHKENKAVRAERQSMVCLKLIGRERNDASG